MHKIHAELFENIIKPREIFIIVIWLHVKSIHAGYQVKIQLPKTGNFIGQEPVEIMLDMSKCMEIGSIAELVDR